MALETIRQTHHQHAIDQMSSGHLKIPVRPSLAKMMQDFDGCVGTLTALQARPLPLNPSDMYHLDQLNAKSAELEGHLNYILRENGGMLPGVSREQAIQILNNSNVFKQTLGSLNATVSHAAQQQQANMRRNQNRGTFQRQLGIQIRNQLTPTVMTPGSEKFGHQMQTELDRFHYLADGVSKGYLQLTPEQLIETADMFAHFQDFARRHNVALPVGREQALQSFLGQMKERVLGQQSGTSPASTMSHPASPSSASPSSPRPSIATASSAASSTDTLNSAHTDSSGQSWLKRQSQNAAPIRPLQARGAAAASQQPEFFREVVSDIKFQRETQDIDLKLSGMKKKKHAWTRRTPDELELNKRVDQCRTVLHKHMVGNRNFVIEIDGKPAGVLSMSVGDESVKIHGLVALPGTKGVGREAIKKAVEMSKAEGRGGRVDLEFLEFSPSRNFYEHLGFVKNGNWDDNKMCLSPPDAEKFLRNSVGKSPSFV